MKFQDAGADQPFDDEPDATTEATRHFRAEETENTASQRLYDPEELEEQNGQIEKTMQEIEAIKADYNYSLQAKNLNTDVEVTLYQGASLYDPNQDLHKKDASFVLKPNPIMRLDRVVGWHPSYTAGKVYFNHDPKLSKEILFTQANMMLGFYPPM